MRQVVGPRLPAIDTPLSPTATICDQSESLRGDELAGSVHRGGRSFPAKWTAQPLRRRRRKCRPSPLDRIGERGGTCEALAFIEAVVVAVAEIVAYRRRRRRGRRCRRPGPAAAVARNASGCRAAPAYPYLPSWHAECTTRGIAFVNDQ